MVIGSGLLATTFMHYQYSRDVTIFASGVSNSSTINPADFEREINLLTPLLSTKTKLIYFSTISVYDPELQSSPYILHKRQIESLIRANVGSYIIFRLPILLGHSSNPNTLINALVERILTNKPISIYTNACRYIIDVSDLNLLLSKMIDSTKYDRQVIDVNYNNPIRIQELISILETVLGIKATINLLNKGGCYSTENQLFLNFADSMEMIPPTDYLQNRLYKYYR